VSEIRTTGLFLHHLLHEHSYTQNFTVEYQGAGALPAAGGCMQCVVPFAFSARHFRYAAVVSFWNRVQCKTAFPISTY
jgi:hypothetical protein